MNQTINVSLPKGLTDLARAQVKAGYYSSISEVIRDALRKYFMEPHIPTIQLSQKAEKQFEQALEAYQAGKTEPLKNIDDLDNLL
jgi:putative addiction module CopG family antidote